MGLHCLPIFLPSSGFLLHRHNICRPDSFPIRHFPHSTAPPIFTSSVVPLLKRGGVYGVGSLKPSSGTLSSLTNFLLSFAIATFSDKPLELPRDPMECPYNSVYLGDVTCFILPHEWPTNKYRRDLLWRGISPGETVALTTIQQHSPFSKFTLSHFRPHHVRPSYRPLVTFSYSGFFKGYPIPDPSDRGACARFRLRRKASKTPSRLDCYHCLTPRGVEVSPNR